MTLLIGAIWLEAVHIYLFNISMQTSDWMTIFSNLGENYNASENYTLTDFSLLNLYDYSDVILEICHDAIKHDKLKDQVILQHMSYME